jgi:hypothetical protein
MAAIWLLLFDESKAMMNVRSLEASIPELGDVLLLQTTEKAIGKARVFGK